MPANERDWWRDDPTEELPGHDLPRRYDPRAPTEPMRPVRPRTRRAPRPPRGGDTWRDRAWYAGARAWEVTCILARYWRIWLVLWFAWVYSQPSAGGAFQLTATVLGVGLAVALIVGIVSWCLRSLRVFSR